MIAADGEIICCCCKAQKLKRYSRGIIVRFKSHSNSSSSSDRNICLAMVASQKNWIEKWEHFCNVTYGLELEFAATVRPAPAGGIYYFVLNSFPESRQRIAAPPPGIKQVEVIAGGGRVGEFVGPRRGTIAHQRWFTYFPLLVFMSLLFLRTGDSTEGHS